MFEQFLNNGVSKVVRRKLGDLRQHVRGNVLDLLLGPSLIVDSLSDVPKLWSIMDTVMGWLWDGWDLGLVFIVTNGGIQAAGDLNLVVLRCSKFSNDIHDISLHVTKSWNGQRSCSRPRDDARSGTVSLTVGAAFSAFHERIWAGRGELAIVSRSTRRRGGLCKIDSDGASTREDFLPIHHSLGGNCTLQTLEIDKSTVLVGEHASRYDGAV